MPKFSDVASSRDIEKMSALLGDVPDTSTEEGIANAVELIYQSVRTKINDQKAPIRIRAGQKGFHWQGNFRRDIVFPLWPSLDQTMLVEREEANDIIAVLKANLERGGHLVCVATSKYHPSTWWVNDRFLPVIRKTVTPPVELAPEPTVETATAAPQEPSVKLYPCRVCTTPFEAEAGRITHEMKVHRVAIGDDGTEHSFDKAFDDAHMRSIVHAVLREYGHPMAHRAIEMAALAKDPRMRRTQVSTGLNILMREDLVGDVQIGARTKYYLMPPEAQAPSSLDPEPEETVVPDLEAVAESNGDSAAVYVTSSVPSDIVNPVAKLKHVLSTAKGCVDEALRAMGNLEEQVQTLTVRLAEKERELAALRIKQMAPGATGGGSARVRELEAELAAVTADRDEYKAKWGLFQQAVNGIKSD